MPKEASSHRWVCLSMPFSQMPDSWESYILVSSLRMPCHFPFCSYHSFCQNEQGIILVGVSVCEPGQQALGVGRAGRVETPKPFLAVSPSETERACWCALCTSGSEQVTPTLLGPQERMHFVGRLRRCWFSKSLGGRKGEHHAGVRCILEAVSITCGDGI